MRAYLCNNYIRVLRAYGNFLSARIYIRGGCPPSVFRATTVPAASNQRGYLYNVRRVLIIITITYTEYALE